MKLLVLSVSLLALAACGGGAATSLSSPVTTRIPIPATATAAPPATTQRSVLTPTATLRPGPPPVTPVTVWPRLSPVEPSTAAPGDEIEIDGRGGITELRTADGRVTGYIESARSFDLYFDGEAAGSIGCYVHLCQGTLTIPAGASPGRHEISVEGGSSIQLLITQTATPTATPASDSFVLDAAAFASGDTIPVRYTCDGSGISPALSWGAPPPGTQSQVLIMDDPDAPAGVWDHWVVFDLPSGLRELTQDQPHTAQLPSGGTQGRNSWGDVGYGGPCPPPGPAHTYRFFLYALDISLGLTQNATKLDVLAAIAGHILEESLLTGIYGRG